VYPRKGEVGKKASQAKKTPKVGKASAKPAKTVAGPPREGSKTAQVLAMLRRKNGATITEIMKAMGWQRHTGRGFMAGALKGAGYEVESSNPREGSGPTASIRSSIRFVPYSPARHCRGGLFCFWVAVVPHVKQPPSARTWANCRATRATPEPHSRPSSPARSARRCGHPLLGWLSCRSTAPNAPR